MQQYNLALYWARQAVENVRCEQSAEHVKPEHLHDCRERIHPTVLVGNKYPTNYIA